MVPVLAAAAVLLRTQAEALEHGPPLLERVIVARTSTESVAEVLVVCVVRIRGFRVDGALGVRFGVETQRAGARGRKSRGTAVACEVAFVEKLDQPVLAVALNRASVASTSSLVWLVHVLGWGIAGETGEDALAQWTEWLCAILNALRDCILAGRSKNRMNSG
jgi:hypothetical protein